MSNDFKSLWRKSNLNNEDVFDLVLILILWRYLTHNIVSGQSGRYKWTDPGSKYHFDAFEINNTDDLQLVKSFRFILKEWIRLNSQLDSVFVVDNGNLRRDTLIKAWELVKEMTPNYLFQNQMTKEFSKSLLDNISSAFVNDWQFAHEGFTPSDLSELIAGLVKTEDAVSVYDPFCGSGNLLHATLAGVPNTKSVAGASKDSFMQKFTRIRSFLLDIPFDLFDDKEQINQKFDIIITNPPFGIKETPYRSGTEGNKWTRLITNRRSEAIYLTHVLNHLSENGTAAVILPNGILSEKSTGLLRKQIIEQNLVEAVIHLPNNIFFQTRVSASILILNKKKNNNDYLFIDASSFGIKNKNRVQLTEGSIQSILNFYDNYKHNRKFLPIDNAISVEVNHLRKNGYDLLYTIYKSPIEHFKPRPSRDILAECLTLETELANIKRKINDLLIRP